MTSDRNEMLNKIEEGMSVYDSKGEKVGTVEFIHFSEADESRTPGAASSPSDLPHRPFPVDILGKIFGTDDLPKEMKERLLMKGFIKMDSAHLFGSDRYVMFDQIAKVSDGVHLRVEDSEGLLKS